MYNTILIIHILVCSFLVVIILIQRGRGGGLVEALSGAESLFGTKTSSFLVKTTVILSIVFFITSTSLAWLSKQKGKSVFQKGVSVEEALPEENSPVKPNTEKKESDHPPLGETAK